MDVCIRIYIHTYIYIYIYVYGPGSWICFDRLFLNQSHILVQPWVRHVDSQGDFAPQRIIRKHVSCFLYLLDFRTLQVMFFTQNYCVVRLFCVYAYVFGITKSTRNAIPCRTAVNCCPELCHKHDWWPKRCLIIWFGSPYVTFVMPLRA